MRSRALARGDPRACCCMTCARACAREGFRRIRRGRSVCSRPCESTITGRSRLLWESWSWLRWRRRCSAGTTWMCLGAECQCWRAECVCLCMCVCVSACARAFVQVHQCVDSFACRVLYLHVLSYLIFRRRKDDTEPGTDTVCFPRNASMHVFSPEGRRAQMHGTQLRGRAHTISGRA